MKSPQVTEYELRQELAHAGSAEQRGLHAVRLHAARRWRVPDLRIDTGRGQVAIELELHPKSAGRMIDILTGHAYAGWTVIYLAPAPVGRVVAAAADRIGRALRPELALQVWPAPVAGARAGWQGRPDPQAIAAVAAQLQLGDRPRLRRQEPGEALAEVREAATRKARGGLLRDVGDRATDRRVP